MISRSLERRLATLEAKVQRVLTRRIQAMRLHGAPPKDPVTRAAWEQMVADEYERVRRGVFEQAVIVAVAYQRGDTASRPEGPLQIGGYLLGHPDGADPSLIWWGAIKGWARPCTFPTSDAFAEQLFIGRVVFDILQEEGDALREEVQRLVGEL